MTEYVEVQRSRVFPPQVAVRSKVNGKVWFTPDQGTVHESLWPTRPAWALDLGPDVWDADDQAIADNHLDWYYAGKWRKHDDPKYGPYLTRAYPAREPVAREPETVTVELNRKQAWAFVESDEAETLAIRDGIREALDHLEG